MEGLPDDETFYRELLGEDYGKTLQQRGIQPFHSVQLYAKRARTDDPNSSCSIFVGTATTVPHREQQADLTDVLHGHPLKDNEIVLYSYKLPQVADNPLMTKMISEIHYPYTFHSSDDLPGTLGALRGGTVFLWDVRALKNVPSRHKITTTTATTGAPEHGQNNNAQASNSGQQQSNNSQANSGQGGNSSSGQAGNANTPVSNNNDNSADANEIVLLNSDEENERDQDQEDNRGVHFNHKVLKQGDYVHVIVRAKITQISDFEHPLRTVDETHKNALRGKFLDPTIGFHPKTSGLMTTTILKGNLGENEMVHDLLTKHPSQVAGSTPIYTLNEGRTMTIVDGRHRRGAILDCSEIDQAETNWARDYIQFSLIIRKDNNLLTEWEVLMFSKQKNDSSSLVRATTTVVDLLSGIVSYAKIFQSTYNIDYMEARISTIADDMLNSQFLSFAKSTIRKYVRLSRCLLKFATVKEYIFEKCPLTNCMDGGRNNMSYFTDNTLLTANEEDMLLMLKCVTGFYENVDKGRFKPDHFYKICKMFISETRQYFERISSIPESPTTASYPKTYSAFMTTMFRLNNSLDTTPQDYIISTMSGYSFSSGDGGKSTNAITKRAATRMKSKLDERYLLGKKDAPTKSGPGIVGSAIPRRRNRKRSVPIIDLADSDNEPEKKKHKKTTTTGTGGKRIPKGSKRTKATLRSAGRNDAASAQGNGGGAGDDNGGDDDEERRFDDSFDVSRPPTNWEQQHEAFMRMKDDDITKEFFMNIRSVHKVTSEELGEEWDAEHVIRQQEGSADSTAKEVQDPSAYLRSVHIPKDHRSHVFVPLEHFKVLRSLATYWGIYGELYHSRTPQKKSDQPEENWMETIAADPYLCKSFFNSKQTELEHRGYTILPGMADPLSFPQHSIDALVPIPDDFPTMKVVELFDAVHKMFPGEDNLREEEDRDNWSPIINSRNNANDENDRNMGIGRYSSTNKFLTETLEKGDYVHLAQRRAYLDVWIGIMVSLLNVDDNGKVNVYIPRTGGRWLLTGRYCKIQVGHNDFHIILGSICPGYFAIVTGAERVYLWVCPGSHQYVHYNKKEREGLSANLKMERIEIPPNSIFIGHGHLQHAGDGYNGSHCIRYHTYIAPEDIEIPDAIIFGYENSLGCLNARTDASADRPNDAHKNSASSTKRYPAKSKQGQSTKNVVSPAEENESDDNGEDPHDDDYTLDSTGIPDV